MPSHRKTLPKTRKAPYKTSRLAPGPLSLTSGRQALGPLEHFDTEDEHLFRAVRGLAGLQEALRPHVTTEQGADLAEQGPQGRQCVECFRTA